MSDPAFQSELKTLLGDDVCFEELQRGIHATDASHYQIVPQAVATPRTEDDVAQLIRIAAKHRVPITARGAATSLSGQTHGNGIILDLSRHMAGIPEINPKEGWARVQPGVVRDQLNAEAAQYGLHFAPDPATTSRATIGGMIGNNSSGTRSVLYGKTSDHLLSARVILADGTVHDLSDGMPHEAEFRSIVDRNAEKIREHFPTVMRRVSGYALDAFLEPDANPAHLFCGSEGTLGILTEATVRLVPVPKASCVVAVHFHEVLDSLGNVEPMLRYQPAAIELLDDTVLNEAKVNPATRHLTDFFEGSPAALQLVEFLGDDQAEVESRADEMVRNLKEQNAGYAWKVLRDKAEQTRAWDVRRLGLGLITNVTGATKGQAVIEDACIPLPHLAEYTRRMLEKCAQEHVHLVVYGHASVGVLHLRPELDLHKQEDIDKMRRIAECGFGMCMEYGGAWAGEHGDGIVRGEFIERSFGPEVYAAFREVKQLFDPDNLLNPGKLIDPPPMDDPDLMRYGKPGYADTTATSAAKALFHYRNQGGFALAVEQCNGVGACRKLGKGVMCPSYMATRREADSTRGRANALRLAMSGQLCDGDADAAMASDEMMEVMKLCLSCKACKSECPNAVDVAKLKAEVLQRRYDEKGTPLSARIIGNMPVHAHRLCGWHAPLVNAVQASPPVRMLLKRLANIDPQRPLPRFARRSLKQQWRGTNSFGEGTRGEVALYVDSYTNCYDPHIGEAAKDLLVACGFKVRPAFAGDSQRARISKGLLHLAKRDGAKLMVRLDPYTADETPILCLEPSCASALKDDLVDLIDDAALGERVAAQIFLVDEFLADADIELEPTVETFVVHGHCHQKAVFNFQRLKSLLPSARMIEAGCCGMAGAFGYENRDVSLKIGEDRLFPALRNLEPGTEVMANGFSCRHQVQDALGIMPKHFVELVSPKP